MKKLLGLAFNDEKIVEHEQSQFIEAGPIGLQGHNDTPGMRIEYRNLRVMAL